LNGYLLDTNVALLAVSRSAELSGEVRGAMERGTNYLSVIVYWEVMLKSMKGALKVGDPRIWWFDALEQLAARPLVLRPEHVTAVHALPPIHKDPFDRVLIAQAMVEDLTLLTTDSEIPQYASERFRVVS
jgi:PIN domain nuclease of toxin-antitoxin system